MMWNSAFCFALQFGLRLAVIDMRDKARRNVVMLLWALPSIRQSLFVPLSVVFAHGGST